MPVGQREHAACRECDGRERRHGAPTCPLRARGHDQASLARRLVLPHRWRERRTCRGDLAGTDAFDQILRFALGSAAELTLQHAREGLRLRQRFVAAAVARIQDERDALPVLAQRVDREQLLGHAERLRGIDHKVGACRERVAQPCRSELRALALLAHPLLEPFLLDVQPGQEFAAEQAGGAVEVVRIG